jgi:hypothetical protein
MTCLRRLSVALISNLAFSFVPEFATDKWDVSRDWSVTNLLQHRRKLCAFVQLWLISVQDYRNVPVPVTAAATRLLRSWVWIPLGSWIFVCYECCLLSGRGLWRRADHSSRGVLPTVVRRCVWSRNLKNEDTNTRVGSQRHRKKIYI